MERIGQLPARRVYKQNEDGSADVYWIPLYATLEQRGFEVYFVNHDTLRIYLGARAMCKRANG